MDHEIVDVLREKGTLAISEILREKYYTECEIINLTQDYFVGDKTGFNKIENVQISISFDMVWQKKGKGILMIPIQNMYNILDAVVEKSYQCWYNLKSVPSATLP